jgi:hypothetical protein
MSASMRGNTEENQQGFVAIVVTMILMVVLVLVTVGFLRIIGREQRQVLDRQLSNQAFYAAETGINDAAKALADPVSPYTTNKTVCGPDGTIQFPNSSNKIDGASGNVEYSCLTIDQQPRSLKYSSISKDDAKVIRFSTFQADGTTPVNITRLRISWQAESGVPTFSSVAAGTFLPVSGASNWGANTGVLRAALTPLVTVDRNALIANTFTTFLYPGTAAANQFGQVAYTSTVASQGSVVDGRCNTANTPKSCIVEITGLNGSSFLLVLRSVYAASSVEITAHNGGVVGTTSNDVRIGGAQSLVDATGKASDVLRRLVVRIPTRNSYAMPAFTLNSADDICKQYSVAPASTMAFVTNPAGACTP